MSTSMMKYGNVVSGIMADSKQPIGKVGDKATIFCGRDRRPALVVKVEHFKSGGIKGYWLQPVHWTVDFETEGYAKEIHFDQPKGEAIFHPMITRGKKKGRVQDAAIGHASAFYDRSF